MFRLLSWFQFTSMILQFLLWLLSNSVIFATRKWEKLFFENFKTLWDKDKNIIWIIEEVSCRTGSLKSLTCDQAGFFTAVTCINRFNSFDCRCPQEKFLTINVKLNQVCLKCFLPLKGPHGNNRWLCFRVYRKVRGACKTYSKKKGKKFLYFL